MAGKARLSRRELIAGAAGGVIALKGGEGSPQQPSITAAVMEFGDRWTGEAKGLAELLRRGGADVQDLPPGSVPDVDLIAFGSFANNGPAYADYVKAHADGLRSFVASGGVVLEMAQSDQFGAAVPYLPEGMFARRGDRDLEAVRALAKGHPLTAWMPAGLESVSGTHFDKVHPNWESLEEWRQMQVILCSLPGGQAPCLLAGDHGKGRFLVSSLYIDKCFDAQGKAKQSAAGTALSAAFFTSVVEYVAMVKAGVAPASAPTPMPAPSVTGPMIGHVDQELARIWMRPAASRSFSQEWIIKVTDQSGKSSAATATPDADHDFTMLFDVEIAALARSGPLRYAIWSEGRGAEPIRGSFRAPPAPGEPAKVVLGLGSCAPSDPNRIWTQVMEEGCQGFVFLGDTPYVDTSNLAEARERHRTFLSQPEIAQMIRQMPCWGTWDDHDFGRNDGHGDFPGKHVCRLAFTEYRANADFGQAPDGNLQSDRFGAARGIQTSLRFGPLEIFLIDPRWFSRTGPSWADASQPTCLGEDQWEWLQGLLTRSTATFKGLATGMIWDDKKNSEMDDWHTYRHEREAIFDFIRSRRIPGCFLISGDIHVSRALNYGPRVGYDLWQFIVSPMHDRVIPSLNVPHPNLVHDAVEPHVFLRLEADTTADPARLHARWVNLEGKLIFEVELTSADLMPG